MTINTTALRTELEALAKEAFEKGGTMYGVNDHASNSSNVARIERQTDGTWVCSMNNGPSATFVAVPANADTNDLTEGLVICANKMLEQLGYAHIVL